MDEDRIEHLEEQVVELKAQNELINNTLSTLIDKIDLLVAASTPRAISPQVPVQKSHVKPSPSQEFSRDRAKGQAFLNSCELYLRLAPHQFTSEHEKVSWAYSFMKSGCAALFVDRMLHSEMRNNKVRYATWSEFRKVFQEEFCPKNEAQVALAKLETSGYYQGHCSMDEYVNKFRVLIDQAGYMEGLGIVTKFQRGLQTLWEF